MIFLKCFPGNAFCGKRSRWRHRCRVSRNGPGITGSIFTGLSFHPLMVCRRQRIIASELPIGRAQSFYGGKDINSQAGCTTCWPLKRLSWVTNPSLVALWLQLKSAQPLRGMKASNLTMRGNVSDSFKSKSSGFSLALNVPGIIMSQQMTAPGSEISDPSARFYEGLEPGKIIRWGLNLLRLVGWRNLNHWATVMSHLCASPWGSSCPRCTCSWW